MLSLFWHLRKVVDKYIIILFCPFTDIVYISFSPEDNTTFLAKLTPLLNVERHHEAVLALLFINRDVVPRVLRPELRLNHRTSRCYLLYDLEYAQVGLYNIFMRLMTLIYYKIY